MLRQQTPTAGYSDQERESSRPVVHAKTWTSASRPANVAQEAAARVLAGQKIGPDRAVSSASQPRPATVVSASAPPPDYGKQVGSLQTQSQSSPSAVPTAAAHFQTPAYHVQQTSAQESHRSSDASSPQVNPVLPRQDSLSAPPGVPQLPGSEDVIIRQRLTQKFSRQDSLPSEADGGQTEVHPAHSRRFPSGRHLESVSTMPSFTHQSSSALEAASPASSFTRPSSSAASSQPLREPDRTGTLPMQGSQASIQADPLRLEEERQSVNERHRRNPDGGEVEQLPEAYPGQCGHSQDPARRSSGDLGHPGQYGHSQDHARRSSGDLGHPGEQKLGSPDKRRNSGDAGQPGQPAQPGQTGDPKLKADNQYLRRNVEHLRKVKHVLERHIKGLEARNQWLEQQMGQYKATLEQKQAEQQRDFGQGGGNVAVEIQNLNDQLEAVMSIKQALNLENEELMQRLRKRDEEEKDEVNRQHCVVCMDSLANVVCLPCKHLSMCMDCGHSDMITLCPICRVPVQEKMEIFCP